MKKISSEKILFFSEIFLFLWIFFSFSLDFCLFSIFLSNSTEMKSTLFFTTADLRAHSRLSRNVDLGSARSGVLNSKQSKRHFWDYVCLKILWIYLINKWKYSIKVTTNFQSTSLFVWGKLKCQCCLTFRVFVLFRKKFVKSTRKILGCRDPRCKHEYLDSPWFDRNITGWWWKWQTYISTRS